MTSNEFEYSPDAIKQYIAAQKRVSNWVKHAKKHAPSDPFTPPTRPSSPSKPDCPRSRTRYGNSRPRPASDKASFSGGKSPSSSLGNEYRCSTSSSAPSRHTEQSACYTESTYRPHPSITTQPSSHTFASRHTRKSSKTRPVGAHKDRTATISCSKNKGYMTSVRGERGRLSPVPLSWKKMEACVIFSILLLLFLSWWATSETSCINSTGTLTHTRSNPSSATILQRNVEKKQV